MRRAHPKLSVCVLSVLAAGLALVGCGPYVAGLFHDPTFTHSTAVEGGIAVGGVVSVIGELTPEESGEYGAILMRELDRQRPEFKTASPTVVATLLGSVTYDEILNEYAREGALSDTLLRILQMNAEGYRYIVFARIFNNKCVKERSEGTVKDANSEVVEDKLKVTMSHRRSMEVSMHVYDLTSLKLAWSGIKRQSEGEENVYTVDDPDTGFLGSIVESALGIDRESHCEYPAEAPTTYAVMLGVFPPLVSKMPGG